jgi:hypothetical protein
MIPMGFVMKFYMSPWPEIKDRKLQIGARIPPDHAKKGFGTHHVVDHAGLAAKRSKVRDSLLLSLDSAYAACGNAALVNVHRTWYHTFDGELHLKGDCGLPAARTALYPFDDMRRTIGSRKNIKTPKRGNRWPFGGCN